MNPYTYDIIIENDVVSGTAMCSIKIIEIMLNPALPT